MDSYPAASNSFILIYGSSLWITLDTTGFGKTVICFGYVALDI